MQHRFGEERKIDSSSRTGLMTQSVEIADGLDWAQKHEGDNIRDDLLVLLGDHHFKKLWRYGRHVDAHEHTHIYMQLTNSCTH